MAGANNKQLKAAGMTAKAVQHVRSTQGVVSSLASAAKSAKRAGMPMKGEAGKKLARPAPKVTWGEKVAASKKKAADAMSVESLMKRSESSGGPKLPTHVSQVGQGSFAHPKNTVRENRLHWAATKAKETGKQAYVVQDTSRHAAQSGGLKLTYKQPKSGKYMAVSPSGAISYHGAPSAAAKGPTVASAAKAINESSMSGKARLAAKKQLRRRVDRMLANDRRARASA